MGAVVEQSALWPLKGYLPDAAAGGAGPVVVERSDGSGSASPRRSTLREPHAPIADERSVGHAARVACSSTGLSTSRGSSLVRVLGLVFVHGADFEQRAGMPHRVLSRVKGVAIRRRVVGDGSAPAPAQRRVLESARSG
jgi:hypothetical protein